MTITHSSGPSMAQRLQLRKLQQQKQDFYKNLDSRLGEYCAKVDRAYQNFTKTIVNCTSLREAALAGEHIDVKETMAANMIKDFQKEFTSSMYAIITGGATTEWQNANVAQDKVADAAQNYYGVRDETFYDTKDAALQKFLQRKTKGLNLMDRVEKQSMQALTEYEAAINVVVGKGVEEGTSAAALATKIMGCIQDFSNLKKDYEEMFGKKADLYDVRYKSIRLARNEINLAYRTAENERMKNFDFVKGYEIKCSDSHPQLDICDELAGQYPKDFVFTGWHPNCMCYAVPIVMEEEEYWQYKDQGEDIPDKEYIQYMPDNFDTWVGKNIDTIEAAQAKGTAPYFIQQNQQIVADTIAEIKEKSVTRKVSLSWKQLQKEYTVDDDVPKDFAMTLDLGAVKTNLINITSKYGIQLKKFTVFEADEAEMTSMVSHNVKEAFRVTYRTENNDDFCLKRVFWKDDKGNVGVYHELFNIADQYQGKGISKEVFRMMYKEYEAMGVTRIDVHANIDVGGYTWARYGFCMKDKAEVQKWVRMHDFKFQQNGYTSGSITKFIDDYYAKNKLTETSPFPMNELVNYLGREDAMKILTHTSWSGTIDLTNAAQRETFEKYLGITKKTNPFSAAAYTEERKAEAILAVDEYDADDLLRKKTGEVWNTLSTSQKEALFKYTDGSCEPIQYGLRGLREMSDGVKELVKNIDAVMEKTSLEQDMYFMRGESVDGLKKFGLVDTTSSIMHMTQEQMEKALVGKEAVEDGFWSCGASENKGFEDKIMWKVYCPKGTKGIYAEPFSKYGNGGGLNWDGKSDQAIFGETEFLVARGGKYRVTGVWFNKRYNRWDIDVELIGYSPKKL